MRERPTEVYAVQWDFDTFKEFWFDISEKNS